MKIYEYVVRIKDEGINKLRQLANTGNSIRNSLGAAGRSVLGFGGSLRRVGGDIANFLGLNSALVRTLGPAALVATMALTGKQAITLAADLQQTKVGFEVMLGSAEKANKMIAELREMAKFTPFESKDLFKASEIMLGFGIAGEKVKGTLNMLGDVSRGNAEKLRLITLAYSQIHAAGRLMGQDLLQLINAGFNPLQEISKKTGKSMAVLKKEMEDGKISFAMVEDAFRTATSEGGRFFGMMEKQSHTFYGIASTLRDEWNEALTAMGEKLLPSATRGLMAMRSILSDLTTRVNFTPLINSFNAMWGAIKDVWNMFGELFALLGMNTSQLNVLQTIFNGIAFSLRMGFLPLRFLVLNIKALIELVKAGVPILQGFGLMLQGVFTQNISLIKIGFDQAKKGFTQGLKAIGNEISSFAKKEKDGFAEIFNTDPLTINPSASAGWNPFGKQFNDITNGTGGAGGDTKVQDGIDKITGGGRQAVNVTINLENLVGVQNFDVTNVKESIQDMQKMVTEALLRTLNSANYAASQ